jgi:type III protein arginine methyltransferase
MNDDFTLVDKAFEPLLKAAAGNVHVLLKLAEQSRHRGDLNRAIELAKQAKDTAPDNPEAVTTANEIISRAIPNWHVSLVKDHQRNDAFEAALIRNIKPGMRVLDVGAGTGLLAMMAARAGADKVFSCELNPAMAAVAADVVRANGFADKITIIAKNSKDIDANADMDGRADLVVAEILGSDLVCEQVLPAMRDVVSRLAKPGAQLIPQSGDIVVALAHWDDLNKQRMDNTAGFDLSPFNQLQRPSFKLHGANPTLHLRGTAANLFSFDFSDTQTPEERVTMDLVADGGQVNGVVQWIRLQMDEEGELENRPGREATSSWACLFHPLPEAVETVAGQAITIGASHNGNRLRIWAA